MSNHERDNFHTFPLFATAAVRIGDVDKPKPANPDHDPTKPVALQGMAPQALRDAVKANSKKGPEMQMFYAAAVYAALRKPREQDWAMVTAYEDWVKRGCPEIIPAATPASEGQASDEKRPPQARKRLRAG